MGIEKLALKISFKDNQRLYFLMGSLGPKSWLVFLSLFLSYVAICSADALKHWAWADRFSCMPKKDNLSDAWDEFATLADRSFHVLSRPMSTRNREMLKAMYNLPINQTEGMKSRLSFSSSIPMNIESHQTISYRKPQEYAGSGQ